MRAWSRHPPPPPEAREEDSLYCERVGEFKLYFGNLPRRVLSLSGLFQPRSLRSICVEVSFSMLLLPPPLPHPQRPFPLPPWASPPPFSPQSATSLPFCSSTPPPPPPLLLATTLWSLLACPSQQSADPLLIWVPPPTYRCPQGSVYLLQLALLGQLWKFLQLRDQPGRHGSVRQCLRKHGQLISG